MDRLLQIPQSIDEAAIILVLAFALVAIVITVILIFRPRSHGTAIKLLGCLMVLALAFAANNWGVYALSIFIVATVITELDFLEKLAALFWNRDKYWEYRIHSAKGSEIDDKRKKEVAASLEDEAPHTVEPKTAKLSFSGNRFRTYLHEAWVFEQAVLKVLKSGSGPISPAKVLTEIKISSALGSVLLDAIVESAGVHFVVEIKYLKRPSRLLNALHEIEKGLIAYHNYLKERQIYDLVVPVLIVPDESNAPSLFREVLPILKFDQKTFQFSNVKEFLKAVETVEPHALWLQD